MKRILSFSVPKHLIEVALNLPPGSKIVGAEWDWLAESIRLYIESPEFPEVEDGLRTPNVIPVVTVSIGEDGKRIYAWDFNKR